MGATNSADAVAYFQNVMAAHTPPPQADVEGRLASYHGELSSGSDIFFVVEPIARTLMENNSITHRLPWLLKLAASLVLSYHQERVTMLLSAGSSPSVEVPHSHLAAQEAGVLGLEVLLRQVFRLMKDNLAVLNAQLHHSSAGKELVDALMLVAVQDVVVGDGTHSYLDSKRAAASKNEGSLAPAMPIPSTLSMHLAISRLLLTLTSSALYYQPSHSHIEITDVFTEYILSSPLFESFVMQLIHRLVQWGSEELGDLSAAGPMLYHFGCKPSFLGSGLQRLPRLWRGPSGYASPSPRGPLSWCNMQTSAVCRDALYRRSAELLCVLTFYRRGMWCEVDSEKVGTGRAQLPGEREENTGAPQEGSAAALSSVGNPTRAMWNQVLAESPSDDASSNHKPPVSTTGSPPQTIPTCTAESILEVIALHVSDCPILCVLLYTLLVDHPSFLSRALNSDPNAATSSNRPREGPTSSVESTEAAAGPKLGRNAGEAALLRIVYQLLETSFFLHYSRFDLEVDHLRKVADEKKSPTTSPASSHPLTPCSSAYLETVIRQEALRITYPYLEFMVITLLFVLSQDAYINHLLCTTKVSKLAAAMESLYSGPGVKIRFPPGLPEDPDMLMGSLIVHVLCLSTTYAVRDESQPLGLLFAVVLSNLSPFVRKIDTGTSQRVLRTIMYLLRLTEKHSVALAGYSSGGGGEEWIRDTRAATGDLSSLPGPHQDVSQSAYSPIMEKVYSLRARSPESTRSGYVEHLQLAQSCLEVLRVLVEGVEGLLVGKSRSNTKLIYELLYSKDELIVQSLQKESIPDPQAQAEDPSSNGDQESSPVSPSSPTVISAVAQELLQRTRALLRNLENIAGTYYANIENNEGGMASAEEIMKLIEATEGSETRSQGVAPPLSQEGGASRFSSPSSAASHQWLIYAYEESAASYSFFGPFMWSLIFSNALHPGGALRGVHMAECPFIWPQCAES